MSKDNCINVYQRGSVQINWSPKSHEIEAFTLESPLGPGHTKHSRDRPEWNFHQKPATFNDSCIVRADYFVNSQFVAVICKDGEESYRYWFLHVDPQSLSDYSCFGGPRVWPLAYETLVSKYSQDNLGLPAECSSIILWVVQRENTTRFDLNVFRNNTGFVGNIDLQHTIIPVKSFNIRFEFASNTFFISGNAPGEEELSKYSFNLNQLNQVNPTDPSIVEIDSSSDIPKNSISSVADNLVNDELWKFAQSLIECCWCDDGIGTQQTMHLDQELHRYFCKECHQKLFVKQDPIQVCNDHQNIMPCPDILCKDITIDKISLVLRIDARLSVSTK